MNRFISLVVIILFTHLPISCDFEDNCGSGKSYESTITELASFVGSYESNSFSTVESSTFSNAALSIEITNLDLSLIALQNESNNFSFITPTMACSPAEPIPTQTIEKIEITGTESINHNGSEMSPGTSLNELFKVSSYHGLSLDRFVADQNQDPWLFGTLGSRIILSLKEQPDNSINQKFYIVFEFSDAKIIEIETDIFRID